MLFAKRINHVIPGVELLIPTPTSDLWGGEMGWRLNQLPTAKWFNQLCICKEVSIKTLEDTVRGACSQDAPGSRIRGVEGTYSQPPACCFSLLAPKDWSKPDGLRCSLMNAAATCVYKTPECSQYDLLCAASVQRALGSKDFVRRIRIVNISWFISKYWLYAEMIFWLSWVK